LQAVLARNANLARMEAFAKPVSIVFGAEDPFLNEAVAQGFATAFPHAKLQLVPSAGHYVQLDKPDAVVDAIRAATGP